MLTQGGPAFPCKTVNDTDGNLLDPFGTVLCPESQALYSGLSMRDYFAAKAMQAHVAHAGTDEINEFGTAMWAYEMADAMIKARAS